MEFGVLSAWETVESIVVRWDKNTPGAFLHQRPPFTSGSLVPTPFCPLVDLLRGLLVLWPPSCTAFPELLGPSVTATMASPSQETQCCPEEIVLPKKHGIFVQGSPSKELRFDRKPPCSNHYKRMDALRTSHSPHNQQPRFYHIPRTIKRLLVSDVSSRDAAQSAHLLLCLFGAWRESVLVHLHRRLFDALRSPFGKRIFNNFDTPRGKPVIHR